MSPLDYGLSFLLMAWRFWGALVSYFIKCLSVWIFLMCLLVTTQGVYTVREEDHNGKVLSSPHRTNTTYHCWCAPGSPGCGRVCSGVCITALLPSLFPPCALRKTVTTHSLHLEGEVLRATSFRKEQLHTLFEIVLHGSVVVSSYFFIHSFMLVWINE